MTGNIIFIIEKIKFLTSIYSALRFATKVVSTNRYITVTKVKAINAAAKIKLPETKPRIGDHMSKPARNMAANTRLTGPQIVKHVLISSLGFFTLGIKRIKALVSPSILSVATKAMAEIIAELKPTSASL